MTERLRIVLDTNILISALSLKSPFRLVIDAFLDGRFDLFCTTEILVEYEEKLREKYDASTAGLFLDALMLAPNAVNIEIYYQVRLIYPDLDDNKFADCAFAANAHILVTNDRDFNVLKNIEFPSINIMRLEEFMEFLRQSNH